MDENKIGHKEKPVIWAKNLVKHFNGVKAVDGIDLTIYPGELVGILGPNGAGKSTTIRMIYGMSPPTSGKLKVLGKDVSTNARQIKKKIGVVPEESNLDLELTLRENLEIYAGYFDIPQTIAKNKAQELMRFLQLEEKANVAIDALSHGMKRRALLARSLLNKPELLILDEPTVGLDPQGRHLFWQKLLDLKSQGITQILTTHYMEEAAQLCQRVLIMDHGKIITQGPPPKLVKEHIKNEVLEVRLDNKEDEEVFISSFNLENDIQKVEDRLVIFTEDAKKLLKEVEERDFLPEFTLRRHSNLEDVFLMLTGRKLRE